MAILKPVLKELMHWYMAEQVTRKLVNFDLYDWCPLLRLVLQRDVAVTSVALGITFILQVKKQEAMLAYACSLMLSSSKLAKEQTT